MRSWMNNREPAAQICPVLMKMPFAAAAVAASRSASGKMMTGDLPPSSSVTRFRLAPAAERIDLPTRVEPVKAILSTSGCSTSGRPADSPVPVTILTTPSGKPTSWMSWPRRMADSGVCSAGLRTTVHPAASAGAIFPTAMPKGMFHATI